MLHPIIWLFALGAGTLGLPWLLVAWHSSPIRSPGWICGPTASAFAPQIGFWLAVVLIVGRVILIPIPRARSSSRG